MKYCANCGNQLDDNIKFCPVCGVKCANCEIVIDEGLKEKTADIKKKDFIKGKSKNKKSAREKAEIIIMLVLLFVIGVGVIEVINENNETDKDYAEVEEGNNYDVDAKEDEDKDISDVEAEQEIGEMVLVSEAAYVGEDYLISSAEYTYDLNGNNIQISWVSAYASTTSSGYRYCDEYMTYDTAGNILTSEEYEEDGELSECYEYTYYENGELCEIYHYLSESQYDYTFYNEAGQIYEKDSYSTGWGDSLNMDYTMYYYDEYDNLTEETCIDSDDGDIVYSYEYEYEYDENGNIIKEKNDEYGISSTILYEYDASNNLISEKKYNSDGELRYTITYTYDTFDRLSEELLDYSGDTGMSDSTCIYEYDSFGNLVKYAWYEEDGTLSEWKEYTYDFLSNVAVSGDEY